MVSSRSWFFSLEFPCLIFVLFRCLVRCLSLVITYVRVAVSINVFSLRLVHLQHMSFTLISWLLQCMFCSSAYECILRLSSSLWFPRSVFGMRSTVAVNTSGDMTTPCRTPLVTFICRCGLSLIPASFRGWFSSCVFSKLVITISLGTL